MPKRERGARAVLALSIVASGCSLLNGFDDVVPMDAGVGGDASVPSGGQAGSGMAGAPSGAAGAAGAAGNAGAGAAGSGGDSSGGAGGTSGAGGASGDAGAGGLAPLTPDEFLRRFPAAACSRALFCEFKLGLGVLLQVLCHPAVGDALLDQLLQQETLTSFDPERAEACLEALAVRDCSVRNSLFDRACDAFFEPTLPVGATCSSDEECVDGRCTFDGSSCGGVCTALADIGETCEHSSDCKSEAYCDASNECAARRAQNDPCTSSNECAGLLWCDVTLATPVCAPLPDIGEACELDLGGDPCRGSLVCSEVAPGSKECRVGRSLEESCSFDLPCRPGLRCSDATETCVALSESGGPCQSSENCPGGFECVAEACRPRPVLGEDCSPTFDCIQGVCQAGTCGLLDDGATCDGSNGSGAFASECVGYCDTSGAAYVCAPRKPAESTCTDDWECADGSRCVPPGSPSAACVACD